MLALHNEGMRNVVSPHDIYDGFDCAAPFCIPPLEMMNIDMKNEPLGRRG